MELINGDCITEMKKLVDNGCKVDLVLTDLPYGTTANSWDSLIDLDKIWENLNLLSTNITTVLLFGSEPFSTILRMSNINDYKYDIYWIKDRATGFAQCNNKPLKNIETISIFSKGTTVHKNVSKNRMTYNPQGLIEINKKVKASKSKYGRLYGVRSCQKREYVQKYTNYPKMTVEFKTILSNKCLHPTQKPVDLLKYLIKTYSNEEDTVLDFTMGSGSTGVACLQTNRDFIGIELDKKYYDIAVERCKNYQTTLMI